MSHRYLWILAVLALLGAGLGYLAYQNTLVPIPLASEKPLFVSAAPEYGEDAAVVEALLPGGQELDDFLSAQSDLALVERTATGQLVGQLLSELAVSRHGRRWQMRVRPGWGLQGGGVLDAARVVEAIRGEVAGRGGEVRGLGLDLIELRFKARPVDLVNQMAHWWVRGTGPFRRQGTSLTRFEGFIHGRTGLAGLQVVSDPALMESRAWADGLASGRWVFAAYPGHIAPEDMARVRLAPYDEIRMKNGVVWFVSRRLRRLRPDTTGWMKTRIFGVWLGSMDLPYDPLGL